jgi:hypothetical protein
MDKYFKKFNLELTPYNYSSLKGDLAFQYGYPDVIIFLYKIKDIQKFKELHPTAISSIPPTRVFYSEIVGQGYLQPHLDLGVGCNLNWYFEVDQSSTVFYNTKPDTKKLSNFGEAGDNVFHLHELDEVCRFTAELNSAYLLNVNEAHSVYKPNLTTRRFFSYQWLNHDYETILNSLKLDSWGT